ncbi:guanylate kinase [bacterium]|jgi:guanylate kinase|nr:guanylate kinase [bacterium]
MTMILNPKTIVISGPSGVGKGTIIKEILKERSDIKVAISATTRAKREYEVDGEDYYFLSDDTFNAMAENSSFLEWCLVHGNKYGTMENEVKRLMNEGSHVILEIDVQGAKKVMEAKSETLNVISIFLEPPSVSILNSRLKLRNTESNSERESRLKVAVEEIKEKDCYDYIVVNNEKKVAASEILSIINGFE